MVQKSNLTESPVFVGSQLRTGGAGCVRACTKSPPVTSHMSLASVRLLCTFATPRADDFARSTRSAEMMLNNDLRHSGRPVSLRGSGRRLAPDSHFASFECSDIFA